MPSIGSLLQIAKTGLSTQQLAMGVAAHNLANASTEGYSRQRAIIAANPTIRTSEGVFGTGVRIDNVEQIRDARLDAVFYRESGSAMESETRAGVLGRIESLLGEPSDTGLSAALDQFYSGWSEFGSNPNGSIVRSAVRQQATLLLNRFRSLAAGIDSIRQEVDTRLIAAVDRATNLSADVARYTQQIVIAESGGSTAGDLRDARARALTELAELMPIQVTERAGGSMGVNSSGIGIIDGAYSLKLEVSIVGGTYGVAVVGRPGLFLDTGGTVGGLLTVLNKDYPDAIKRLDDLASALVTEVNTVHKTGTNPDGNTNVDFFIATGTKASSIALSAAVLASTDAIAAGTPDGSGNYRAGANDVALAVAALRDKDIASLSMTMGEHYQGLVSNVGSAVRSSMQSAEVSRVLSDQADARRMGLSGVSVDEELVKIIEFQTAYQASARVVTTANEMLQSLLNM